MAHNHPSGNVEPSAEDREITERLRQAGEVLGVRLLDHIVFSAAGGSAWETGTSGAVWGGGAGSTSGSGGVSNSGTAGSSSGPGENPAAIGDGIRYYSFLEKGVL